MSYAKSTLYLFLLFLTLGCQEEISEAIDAEEIRALDLAWEDALLTSDAAFLDSILTDDFIWVHNHASMVDTKSALVERAMNTDAGATGNPRSRESKDVEVFTQGKTAIVTGYTIVDRGPTPTTYHFMRTYVKTAGRHLLMANHTMAVPAEGE